MALIPFVWVRRVEFCETDAAGIAHFSSFLCYMEQAEHAFLRSLGTSVISELEDGWHLSWPRVHVECDYMGTTRFEDQLEILVALSRVGTKSVSYQFQFFLNSKLIAQGAVVAVCCRVKSGEPIQSVAIPEALAEKLAGFVLPPSELKSGQSG